MAIDKINNNSAINKAGKTKKTGQTSAADKTKFSSMVEALTHIDAPDAVESTTEKTGGKRSYVPQEAAERSAWMLRKLEQLYADILAGEPTAAAEDLRAALAADVVDRQTLPPHLRRLVDEIDIRSAVEIAKLEAGNKR